MVEQNSDVERIVLGGEEIPQVPPEGLEGTPDVIPWDGGDLARFAASMLWPVAARNLPEDRRTPEEAQRWIEQYAQSVGPIWDALGAPELFFSGGELPKPVRALLIAGTGVLGLITVWPKKPREVKENEGEGERASE